ncbi:MAG: peptidylprolyl isomerase [Desulfovibrionaceae bacterium]|nr:peptidylprolyl isomerase [Desulfovibrionaceae bacterium]
METSMGRIIVMLSPKDAPKTVENFLKYVNAGFYDGTVFHRVVQEKGYQGRGDRKHENKSMNIVQGGGYTANISKKEALFPPVVNEASTGLVNARGTIAMARTDNPDSATSEFFFNVRDNPILDRKESYSKTGAGSFDSTTKAGYCAFGKVIRGMDVVERIHAVKTITRGRMENVPAENVILKKAYLAR